MAWLSIVLAAIGVITPMLYDWWGKRRELTVTQVSTAVVADAAQSARGLTFYYNGKEVERLVKVVFVVENTGRTTIEKDDLVTNLQIQIAGGRIIDAVIQRVVPENLSAALDFDRNNLFTAFDLLNPSEKIEIHAMVFDDYTGFRASARIKGMDKIEEEVTGGAGSKDYGFDWDAMLIALMPGVAVAVITPGFLKARRACSLLRERKHRIFSARCSGEAHRVLLEDFHFLSGDAMLSARDAIVSSQWPLENDKADYIKDVLVAAVRSDAGGSYLITYFAMFIVAILAAMLM